MEATVKKSRPAMHDPADRTIHQGKPPPRKGDELSDPGKADPKAPHDRGVEKGGRYRDSVDDMLDKTKTGAGHEAWRKGRTQNR
jgi:hypothetical protein